MQTSRDLIDLQPSAASKIQLLHTAVARIFALMRQSSLANNRGHSGPFCRCLAGKISGERVTIEYSINEGLQSVEYYFGTPPDNRGCTRPECPDQLHGHVSPS